MLKRVIQLQIQVTKRFKTEQRRIKQELKQRRKVRGLLMFTMGNLGFFYYLNYWLSFLVWNVYPTNKLTSIGGLNVWWSVSKQHRVKVIAPIYSCGLIGIWLNITLQYSSESQTFCCYKHDSGTIPTKYLTTVH